MKRIAPAIGIFAVVALVAACKKHEEPAPAPAAPPPAATTSSTPPPAETTTEKAPSPITVAANAPVPANGLVLWLHADSGVTAGPTGKVSIWAVDGSPLKAIAEKPEQQPTLVASDIGGKPAIHFDGAKNMLTTDVDINPSVTPQLTVISVFKSDTDANTPLRKLYGHDDGGYDRAAGLDNRASDPNDNYVLFGGSADVVGVFALKANTPYLTVDSYDDAAKVMNVWVNGAPAKQNVQGQHEKGLTQFFIGNTGTVYNENWKGSLSEMLVYARTLTAAERKKVEDYLAAKYGLTLTR